MGKNSVKLGIMKRTTHEEEKKRNIKTIKDED